MTTTNTATNIKPITLDEVLEAMPAGKEMTIAAICEAVSRSRGSGTMASEILICLECANHAHEEGREVQIREAVELAHRLYLRPIVPGLGATYSIGSDRYACTVIAVSPSAHKITTRDDRAIRTDSNGMSEAQSYRYERDPDGALRTFYRNSKGGYGQRGGRLYLGARRSYYDYSF